MTQEWPILTLLTFLPLLGAVFALTVRGPADLVRRNVVNVATLTTAAVFGLSLYLWYLFDNATAAFQFVEVREWLPDTGIGYHVGVDGISMLFVVLSAFLSLICVIAAGASIKKRLRECMVAFLLLETMMIGMFVSLDLLLFYIFFEGVLIPMFLIIGVWGGQRRVYAAFKLFLFTLTGSVLMLLAVLAIYLHTNTTDITQLLNTDFPMPMQMWLFAAFFASFAVKVPMFPLHTWLPDAHVEAPTAGSVILAGVLLKMGGYGFVRFSLPMLPDASAYFAPAMFTLSVIAIIYASLVALAQTDMKKLIAYSSVAHMGFVTLGIFSANIQAVEGALFIMLSHGVVSGALFLCVGVLYDRIHSRQIADYGGLVKPMPRYAFFFMLFMFASIGLPGTGGFVGEILVLAGAFKVSPFFTAGAALGLVLGAAYMLWLYRRVMFGALEKENLARIADLTIRERLVFGSLAFAVILMGVYPTPFLQTMHESVYNLLQNHPMTGTELALFENAKGVLP